MVITDFAQIEDPTFPNLGDEEVKELVDLQEDYKAVNRLLDSPIVNGPFTPLENSRRQKMLKDRYEDDDDSSFESRKKSGINPHLGELTTLKDRLSSTLRQKRWDLFNQHMSIPWDMLIEQDPVSLAAKSPRISTSEIHRIADTLNFVCIPYQYLNESSYAEESKEVQIAIKNFAKLRENMNIYVLCPVNFYSVTKHISSKLDLPIYAPSSREQVFETLSMTIPAFRAMQLQINTLDENVKRVQRNVDAVNKEVQNLQTRFANLEQRFEQELKQRAIERAQQQAKMEALAKQVAEMQRVSALEPLMIAFHAGRSIFEKDVTALVGPCWGPDFSDIVCEVLGLNKIADQRNKVTNHFLQWSKINVSNN